MVKDFLLVGAGGMIGSMLRYGCYLLMRSSNFPFATLAVNIIGSFIIGLVAGWALKNPDQQIQTRLFLSTGICGGFTTFSALSAESVKMLQDQRTGAFLLYVVASLTLGITACFFGNYLTNK